MGRDVAEVELVNTAVTAEDVDYEVILIRYRYRLKILESASSVEAIQRLLLMLEV